MWPGFNKTDQLVKVSCASGGHCIGKKGHIFFDQRTVFHFKIYASLICFKKEVKSASGGNHYFLTDAQYRTEVVYYSIPSAPLTSLLVRAVLTPIQPLSCCTISRVHWYFRFAFSDRLMTTRLPGSLHPRMDPELGQCTVSSLPSSRRISARNRLYRFRSAS